MVEVLHNDTNVGLHNIHLIGFSIGAHIVGYAGRNLKRKGMIIGRITGLNKVIFLVYNVVPRLLPFVKVRWLYHTFKFSFPKIIAINVFLRRDKY